MNSKRIARYGRMTSLIVAMALCLTAAVPAFAATSYDVVMTEDANEVVAFTTTDFDKTGATLTVMTITSLANANGVLKLDGTAVEEGDQIYRNQFNRLSFDPDRDFIGDAVIEWGGDYSVVGFQSGVSLTISYGITTLDALDMSIYVAKNKSRTDWLHVENPHGLSLRFAEVTSPQNGDLWINATTGQYTYTPNKDFVGTDIFKFSVSHATATSIATATAYVSEIAAPKAVDTTVKVERSKATSSSMVATDSNTQSGALTYRIERNPTKGTLTANADGTFTYTHDTDKLGTDSFTFIANNGYMDSNVGTVTIDIELPVIDYRDMNAHWARISAGTLGGADLVVGDRIEKLYYYRPNEIITRADFVILLNAIMGYKESTRVTSVFADVTEQHLVMPLNTAYENGVTAGTVFNGRTYFYPDKSITRIEAMRLLDNALKLNPQNTDTTSELPFADRAQIPDWAVQSVRNLIGYKIVIGSNGYLNPTGTMTRAEAAELLYKAYLERKSK